MATEYPIGIGSERRLHRAKVAAYVVGIAGCLLVVAWMTSLVVRHATGEAVGLGRADERRKNLSDLNAASQQLLNEYAWQDQPKGLIRLPIERAMQLTVAEWKDPKAARAALISKAEKASAPPPKVEYE